MLRYLIFTASFIFSLSISAQNNFAPVGAEWHFSIDGSFGYRYYNVEKDSLFQGENCRYITAYDGMDSLVSELFVLDSARSVFYWHNGAFRKAMDFAVQQGDTTFFDIKTYKYDTTESYTLEEDTIIRLDGVISQVEPDTIDGQIVNTYFVEVINPSGYLDIEHFSYTRLLGIEYYDNYELFPIIDGLVSIPEVPNSFLRCYNDANLEYVRSGWTKPCDYYRSLSTDEVTNNNKITAYPNPVKSQLTIQSQNQLLQSIEIYDTKGRLVFEKDVNTMRAEINTNSFQKGFYILSLKTTEGITIRKIVKD
jgi:hypothetical protein